MSGETKGEVSGWTTDTLHAHLQTVLENQHRSILATIDAACHAHDQRFADINTALAVARAEAERAIVAGNVQIAQRFVGIEAIMSTQFADLKDLLDERYAMQTKAVEAAFSAQQTAMHAAFSAAEKAVQVRADSAEREFHEHLQQNRHETDLAFIASEKAIAKAEVANEKRFESVNEFRAQLTEQAGTFTPRTEFEGQVHALRTEQQTAAGRNAERIQELTDRMNRNDGKGAGLDKSWGLLVGLIGLIGVLVTMYVALGGG
jgi:hypothetical protein